MAQACDLFGITTTAGGSRGCWRKFVDHAAVYRKSSSTGSIASHPFDKLRAGSCKVRKDGAPTLMVMAETSTSLGHPPVVLRE